MKRWGYVVATLNILILAALTLPVTAIAFGKRPDLKDGVDLLWLWPIWLTLFVLQLAMLTDSVRRTGLRPPTHWTKWPPILASGLMMAGLGQGAGLAVTDKREPELQGNEQGMEKAGWITLSNGVYTLPSDSKHLQKLRQQQSE